MHKTTMPRLILFVVAICFFSCKKADYQHAESNNVSMTDKLDIKVKAWLATQKSTYKPAATGKINPKKDATIDLLMNNLIIEGASTEQITIKHKFVTIPVKEEYLEKEKLDKKANLFLQLNMDPEGNINSGNLVYFFANDSKKHTTLPQNTFKNLFNRNRVDLDGVYKMLTLGNVWLSQFEVKNNRLHSASVVTEKNASPSGRLTLCRDWYLVTTYYYFDGSSSQTEEFLGTTCTGSGEGSGCNGNPGEPQVPCGDTGPGPSEEVEKNSEHVSGGNSMLDPAGSGTLQNVVYEAWTDATIHKWTRIILHVLCYKPTVYPASQYFVDANGILAKADVSIGAFTVSRFPTSPWISYITYTFDSKWTYTYSTGVHGPFTFVEGLSKFLGPY